MKKLVILGGGTAGTMMLNKLTNILDLNEWQITVVDQFESHYYQPGFLFIPFGIYSRKDVMKPKRDFFPSGVNVIISEIDIIEPDKKCIMLKNNIVLTYDYLIIATGTKIIPEETEGLKDGLWYKSIFDFYTIEGSCALASFLKQYACKATVDMFHLTKKDFCPQVEDIISVGKFYELSAGAQIIFT